MDEFESFRALIPDLTTAALKRGIDLTNVCRQNGLWRNGRILLFWRDNNAVSYCLQGAVTELPIAFAQSADAFHGGYTESGDCVDLEEATDLLVAWLFKGSDADQLPPRCVRKCSIG